MPDTPEKFHPSRPRVLNDAWAECPAASKRYRAAYSSRRLLIAPSRAFDADPAADGRRFRHFGLSPGERGFQRLDQVILFDLGGVGIVIECAHVGNLAFSIKDEELGRVRRAIVLRDLLRFVVEIGELETLLFRHGLSWRPWSPRESCSR